MVMRSRKKSISVSRCTSELCCGVAGSVGPATLACLFRPLSRSACSMKACCSPRCGSSSGARRSRSSRHAPRHRIAPLTIESIVDPSTLTLISWSGAGYTLRMPGRSTFTPHQDPHAARHRGGCRCARTTRILNPEQAAERGELFRGRSKICYVGAFFDERPYLIDSGEHRVDRIASIIEMLRVAALSTYENRPISTGVLLLGGAHDPCRPDLSASIARRRHTSNRSRRSRASSGSPTACARCSSRTPTGRLLDIIDIDRWSRAAVS